MDDFALGLILNDELRRTRSEAVRVRHDRVVKQTTVVERKDFTAPSPFVFGDEHRQFPVHGVGTVESLLLITAEPDYEITVDVDSDAGESGPDENVFLDAEPYSTLKEISTELTSVSAYQNNEGDEVLDIGPVEFLHSVKVLVTPTSGELTVRRQRAEVVIEQNTQ